MFKIYDNGGKTYDRYTIVCTSLKESRMGVLGGRIYPCVFSGVDPRGMSGHEEAMIGRHLGKRVKLWELPEPVQRLFTGFMASYGVLTVKNFRSKKVQAWRQPSKGEMKFGEGAIHYATFDLNDDRDAAVLLTDYQTLKQTFKSPYDGLMYRTR